MKQEMSTSMRKQPPTLFSSFRLREVILKNRIGISSMAQYSAIDGHPTDWHLVHLGSRAVGGAGLVMCESSAVLPAGRNSPWDLGLWSDDHVKGHKRLADFIRAAGAVPGCQLAHGGRKAGKYPPWDGPEGAPPGGAIAAAAGGWPVMGPSELPFDAASQLPVPMDLAAIDEAVEAFAKAASRAVSAGYEWIEVHAAHGYLIHSFLSPLSNQRTDDYGGALENRCKLARRVAREIRKAIGGGVVLAFRLSFTDWEENGWDTADTVQLARWLKQDGVDLIDVSSGGSTPAPKIPLGLGYQLEGATAVRDGASMPVAAVGLIVAPQQAEQIIRLELADVVMIARQALREPYFAINAASALYCAPQCEVAVQYKLAYQLIAPYRWKEYKVPVHRRLEEA